MGILKQYLLLCCLRINPLDLSGSFEFFKKNLIFYVIVEFFMLLNMSDDISAIPDVLLETTLTLIFVWVILNLNRTPQYFLKIATAVLFCDNFVSVFLVPLLFWITVSDDMIGYIVFGLFVIWDFVLLAYIFKKVLNVSVPASAVVSLFYLVCVYGGAYGLSMMLA